MFSKQLCTAQYLTPTVTFLSFQDLIGWKLDFPFISCRWTNLKPSQTESQIDASPQLASTCDSVWPGLACTCVDLCSLWSRSNLHASRRKFLTVWPPNPSQRKLSDAHNLLSANEIQDMSALKWIFCDLCVLARKLASPFGHPKVSRQVQLVVLATTCESVCPGLFSAIYTIYLGWAKTVLMSLAQSTLCRRNVKRQKSAVNLDFMVQDNI